MLVPLALAVGFTGGLFAAYLAQYRTPCGNNLIVHGMAHITGGHSTSVCWAEIGRMASEGMARGLRKGSDDMSGLKELPKVGDKVRYKGGEDVRFKTGMEIGGVYEVIRVTNSGTARLSTSDGREWEIYGRLDFGYYELVTEPSPSTRDLLANLGRRLSEVEAVLAPKECEFAPDDSAEVVSQDAVNSPQHYKRGALETIDVIKHMTAGYDDPFVAYCVGNAVKYIDRAPYKHDAPTMCLRKAVWYLNKAVDSL